MATNTSPHVDLLILGAGWTSKFLVAALEDRGISYAATSTTGRDGTIPFRFDPDSDAEELYARLPSAKTVVISFPLKGDGQSKHLTSLYDLTHASPSAGASPEGRQWIQLGSTGIFVGDGWVSSSSPYDTTNQRAVAEDELMAAAGGCVLNLAGLYDGLTRDPRNWVSRVAKTKEQLAGKGALHLIHGADVARAVIAVHERYTPRTRWVLTDEHVYDWWDLAQGWADEARQSVVDKGQEGAEGLLYELWVAELLEEQGVRALPRSVERLGRVIDSRDFWKAMGIRPTKTLVRTP
ncbi:hypothetical protein GQ53DRAFT_831011 [Thozetella sp. PMI_491]|nr:hypothetical protein GQ53DRAFT_831011 [Thozetella sp. PMI_491]